MVDILGDRPQLAKAIGLLVRPLARLCIRHHLSIFDFFESCKRVFVEVAEEEIQKAGVTKVNASRVSLMTGLYRRDVMRILRDIPTPVAADVGVPMQVVDAWMRLEEYQTSSGKPRSLSWEGEQSEFFELVRSVSKNYNPATVLFELERAGVVAKTSRGLRLERPYFGGIRGLDHALKIVSLDYEDLLRAVLENLEYEPKVTNLHLRTEYDNIYLDELPKLREWIEREGKHFHERMRDHISKFDKDSKPGRRSDTTERPAGGRVVLGTFSGSSYLETKTPTVFAKKLA